MEDVVIRTAEEFVLKYGYHPTVLWIQGTKERKYILFEDFPDEPEAKIGFMAYAGKTTAEMGNLGNLEQLVLVMEAWMVKLDKGEIYRRPSQHPERIEVLVIGSLDVATQEQRVTAFEYRRDADGMLRELQKYVLPDGSTVAQAESPLLSAFIAGYTHR